MCLSYCNSFPKECVSLCECVYMCKCKHLLIYTHIYSHIHTHMMYKCVYKHTHLTYFLYTSHYLYGNRTQKTEVYLHINSYSRTAWTTKGIFPITSWRTEFFPFWEWASLEMQTSFLGKFWPLKVHRGKAYIIKLSGKFRIQNWINSRSLTIQTHWKYHWKEMLTKMITALVSEWVFLLFAFSFQMLI